MQRSSLATLAALSFALALPLGAQGPAPDSAPAAAAPFGFHEATPLAKLKAMGARLVKGQIGVYRIKKAPEGHPDFESYILIATSKQGLCKVMAIGSNVTTNVFGQQLTSEFDELEAALSAKYGRDDRVDTVRSGSLWTEPQDFMMGLLQQDRTLMVTWTPTSHALLAPNLTGIMLQAIALSTTTGYVSLIYEFENFAKCQAEIHKAEGSVL